MQAPKLILMLAATAVMAFGGENDTGTSAANPAVRQYLDHPSFQWKCEQSRHFEICVEPEFESDHSINVIKRNAERDRAQVLRVIGASNYDSLIHVFLVNSRNRLKDLIGFDGDGRSRPNEHAIFSVVTPYRLNLTHELSHEILTNLWGAAEPWIEEGVATYATESLTVDQHCWHWLSSGQLLPLAKLVNPEWKSSTYSPDIMYPELGGFVKFLRENYGLDRVKEVWQRGSGSMQQVFGKTLTHLEQDWLEVLRQQTRKRVPPVA